MRGLALVGLTGMLLGAAACETASGLVEESRRRRERANWLRTARAMRSGGSRDRQMTAGPRPISLSEYRERTLAAPRTELLQARAA